MTDCRNHRRTIGFQWWSALIPVLLLCGDLQAGSGSVVTLPSTSAAVRNGLTLRIDGRWLNGNGYRPMRVKLSHFPPGPAGSRRVVEVTLEPHGEDLDRPLGRVSETIELPGDVAFVETTIRVPQSSVWNGCRVTVTENGRRLDDLSWDLAGLFTVTGANGRNWTEALPSLLVIDRDVPLWTNRSSSGGNAIPISTSESAPAANGRNPSHALPNILVFHQALPELDANQFQYGPTGRVRVATSVPVTPSNTAESAKDGGSQHPGDIAVATAIAVQPGIELLAPDDVPSQWIDLSAADLIYVSLDDLQYLSSRSPEKANAIRNWTAAGQTLLVAGIGANAARIGELAAWLGLPPDEDPPSNWRQPNTADYGVGFRDAESLRAGKTVSGTPPPGDPAPEARFRLGRFGMGRVIALDDDDPFADTGQFLWALNSLDTSEWAWFQRFGHSMHRTNAGFWNLRIPGVGDPPVVSFLLLITVFSIAIGPLNFWMLRRRKRLYLLLITVPLGAAIVTVLLLGYALIADGLGVRGRTRSVTLLDHAAGRAVTWSRQSYYAGMAPSRGAVFPATATVFPIVAEPYAHMRRRSSVPELRWEASQVLRGGYLRSRELAQFMVVDVSRVPARLDIDWEAGTVRNELGAEIERLFVSDADGNWRVAESLERGAEAKLAPSDSNAVRTAMTQAISLGDGRAAYTGYSGWGRYYWVDVDANIVQPTTSTSLLERQLNRLATLGELPTRSFVAVVDQAEWLPLGIEHAAYDDSLHVVVGSW